MKTNKLYIWALSVLLIFGAAGCTDWLDIRPESEMILDEYWQSESDVEAVLAACYRGMTEEDVIYRMIVWGELRSDNMIAGESYNSARSGIRRILEGELLSTNGYVNWGSFYTVINFCNTLLYYAPDVINRDNNFTQSDLDRVRAEALTIRSLAYFYLVRAFRDVPWVDQPSIDDRTDNFNLPKSTEDEVLSYIIRDLLEAKKYARSDFGINRYNKGRITLSAVNALLADVYLWSGKYQECVNASNEVLADSKLRLVNGDFMYNSVFYNGNSTESIFELQFNDDVQVNNAVRELYGHSGKTSGELSFPATLGYSSYDDVLGIYSPFAYQVSTTVVESKEDIRAKDSYRLAGGIFSIFKFAGLTREENLEGRSIYWYRTRTPNWIIYRLPDVMLMKAEALVQLEPDDNVLSDRSKDALELVNTVYLRSNDGQDSLKIANYTTKSEMANLVLRERHRELLFEGKRWFDLVRLAKREGNPGTLNDFVDKKSSGASASLGAPVMDAIYFPISRREIEANPNLKQNPYYEEVTGSSSR